MTPQSQIEFEKEFSEKLIVHKNLGQEVVVTTVDKVRLCLITNRDSLTAQKAWLTPLAIFLSLLTTLIAANFKEFIFKPDVWTAIYVIGTILSFVWLCSSAYHAWENRSKASLDAIVKELKAQTVQATPTNKQ